MQSSVRKIHVSISRQELELCEGGRVVQRYPVSTSAFGIGTENGSFKTPTGRFAISEKIGHGVAPGTIFKGRIAISETGKPADESQSDDLVLTRILRLDGLEPHNANTRERFIYIHGTNHESSIGSPTSHGCVRMRNADIIALFGAVEEGDLVEIFV